MMTTARLAAHVLADALEREVDNRFDIPEGTATITMSVTLAREIIQALREELHD